MNNYLNEIKKRITEHKKKCVNYRLFLETKGINIDSLKSLEKIPFIHINMFKEYELKSIKKDEVVLELNSSGTSGNKSRIFLDKRNAIDQKKYLQKILQQEFGEKRFPFLILGQNPIHINDRNKISAQIAAFLGFSLIGKNFFYLKNKKNEIDYDGLNEFLKNHHNKEFIIFGFTSNVYDILLKNLDKKKIKFPFSNAKIVHGGGWKKLSDQGITNNDLKLNILKKFKIKNVINYFGFVEQTGSIFLECPKGYFHTNQVSDIFVRDENLELSNINDEGILQCISIVPSSYPGNSVLLEDKAIYKGKNCDCGKPGKIFSIVGRLNKVEIRGCSDIS